MSHAIVITGTDTGIGKTVFSAALAGALDGYYWKPVQAGLDDGSDAQTVARLSGLSPARIVPEAYRLTTPCSPHLAAEIDGITIDVDALHIPTTPGPLVIEGAGGALVPLTRSMLFADLFARWALPLVIVARTGLGTINHSLMTIECLRARGIEPLGIAFVGEAHPDSEAIISTMGRIRRLGRLDPVEPLDQPSLAAAFARGFDPGNFR